MTETRTFVAGVEKFSLPVLLFLIDALYWSELGAWMELGTQVPMCTDV